MTQSQYSRPAVIVLFSCIGLASSCTSGVRSDAFRTSFLPPGLKISMAPSAELERRDFQVLEPPVLQTAMAPKEIPNYLKNEPARMPARPQLDNRIKRAEERFQAGRKLYLEGDTLAARVEFDKVIDILLSSPEAAPDRHLMEVKLEELVEKIHRYDVEGLGAGDDQQANLYDKSPLKEILELTFPIDPSLKNKVKDQVSATTSQLPLEENDEVLRYINYFSSERGKRTLVAGLKRAGRYRDMIRRILDEEGVPQELIFLAQAESGFLPRAISYKAAAGMWQFVKWRGQEYGLKQTAFADERLDPEKATRAGARHLRDLYQQFGDWYLAMAAYNCGPGCVARAVERTGYADFWELRRRSMLPKESSNYVPLIVAMTIMAKNAKAYGLEDVTPEPPLLYDTVEMVANTSVALVADLLDVPMTELRDLNPSLLRQIAPVGHALRIPRGATQSLMAGLGAIPAEKRASWRTHRVLDGETLASISKRYRTAPTNIASVNRVSMEDLRSGDLVIIPAAYVEPPDPAAKKVVRRAPVTVRGKAPLRKAKTPPAIKRKAPARRADLGGPEVAAKWNTGQASVAR